MYFHASSVPDIKVLEPRISNQGVPRVYLSTKRENVLVYLSNAVEKYCKETGFAHSGPWYKWGSYGFHEGMVQLDEYYPDALEDTYKGVPGYIYCTQVVPGVEELTDIPGAVFTGEQVPISGCEYVPDAYAAIMDAADQGMVLLRRYEELPEKMLQWIERCIKQEYARAEAFPEYKHFLRGKFPEITAGLE